jgi:hydrogenase nickel incorporation protein HypA/HybF
MHELAIAESIVDTVLKAKVDKHLNGIRAVGVRIGVMTDIVPEALEFGFEAIVKDTALDGCSLKIERIPVRGSCRACRKFIEVEDFVFICPHCASRDLEITQGQELDITFIEIDDDDATSVKGMDSNGEESTS